MASRRTRIGGGATTPMAADPTTMPAAGPLVVSRANQRYFAVRGPDGAEGRAIYLTGSHIWNNFHDGMGPGRGCPEEPERLDFDAYLAFLGDHGHNFIRLWRWEQFRSQAAGGDHHLYMTPQPWPRVGLGSATDGHPKFDLAQFDPTYFARLRERGIYVAIMFFDGFALHLSPAPGCVRSGTMLVAEECRGRRETGLAADQAAASSAMTAAQRPWNRRRRSDRETRSPLQLTALKYWRCSSKPVQNRAAEAKVPKPRMG
jgi:hypothetical protein